MARVLAVLNREDTARSVLQTARALDRQLGTAGAWALHPRPSGDPTFMPTEEIMTHERQERFEIPAENTSRALRAAVAEWEVEASLVGKGHYAEIVGDPAKTVVLEARRADFTVIAHPLADDDLIVKATFQAAYSEADICLVSAPMEPPLEVGLRPLIAWKTSPALTKAVEIAWPLLLMADHVTVLHAVDNAPTTDSGADDLVKRLRDVGIDCASEIMRADRRHVGDAILEEADIRGSDLLIMGALTHNPLIEWLRTDVTQTTLRRTRLPLLMHN